MTSSLSIPGVLIVIPKGNNISEPLEIIIDNADSSQTISVPLRIPSEDSQLAGTSLSPSMALGDVHILCYHRLLCISTRLFI